MRRRIVGVGLVVLAAAATGGLIVLTVANQPKPTAQEASPVTTATVERGQLSDRISLYGTLTYRAHPDGTPYAVTNQVPGVFTGLPVEGDTVACGSVLYRVDEHPVLLLCGSVPAYRSLRLGDAGEDVRQLNQNLHTLGADAGLAISPDDNAFTERTAKALGVLQRRTGLAGSGSLELGQAVFLPEAARITKVQAELGGSAQPGAPVLDATSDTPEVQLALDPSQQGTVKAGDRVQVTLPDSTAVAGTVDRLGSVAQVQAGQGGGPAAVTIPAYVTLDEPDAARGFDGAPVQVDITTSRVVDALSVPVTALVGKAGGGFAVERVGTDGSRQLVAVTLGLFDSADARVEVEGGLAEGDLVVVPTP